MASTLLYPVLEQNPGFKNQLRYQSMPPLPVDAYSTSAEKASPERSSRRRYQRPDSVQAGWPE
jgi:hypothetical protein